MPAPLLECARLSYRYEDGTQALSSLDLAVAAGEKVALIGPNGSGKSTLLMCLGGLFVGDGAVRLEGVEMTSALFREHRGRIGLVFQSPDDQLFMPTVRDDLAFGPINLGLDPAEIDGRVARAAAAMQLTELLERAPHHLSMGQKRNAAIATVLTMAPAILLMDEPASNLDLRTRRRLIGLLKDLESAMLIASHDLALVSALCSRVVVIDGGRIVADGPTAEILGNGDLMDRHGLAV